jgi:hypothetical protein
MRVKMFYRGITKGMTALLMCGLVFLVGCTQSLSIQPSYTQKTGFGITGQYKVVWDPPGSYLASLDATQAVLNLSLSNATISSTSGTANLSVKDLTTGQIVGSEPFGYVIKGTSVYAQDPAAVYNWLQQFTGYASIDVIVDVSTDLQASSAGTASATGSAVYQGLSYASGTISWEATDTGGTGPCTTRLCPNQ